MYQNMLNKISDDIHRRFEEFINSPLAQQGKKNFEEGNTKKIMVEPIWVKKFVSVKEWNNHYKHNSVYCFLRKEAKKGVWIGFLTTDYVPRDCQLCADEELIQIDDYRRAHNIFPTPLKEKKQRI